MPRLNNLATVAKRTGYPVKEVAGWKTRGSSAYNKPKSVIIHHTASGSKSGNAPSLNVVRNGRPGLPGPLCQILLARDGTIYIVASGRANHAGKTSATKYSNSNSIGIEAENNGVGEKWSDKQMDAYAKLTRELCDAYNISISDVRGHKEIAVPRGRKIDPTFNMNTFRDMVRKRKGTGASGGSSGGSGGSSSSWRTVNYGTMLREGVKGEPVKDVQRFLKLKADGFYGKDTKTAVTNFQKKHKLSADGIVGPDTWSKMTSEGLKRGDAGKPAPSKPSTNRVAFPLPRGHWYGVESRNNKNHSGYHAKDRSGIKKIQKALKTSQDGLYGHATRSAVTNFQRKNKLAVDGLVGEATWNKLFN